MPLSGLQAPLTKAQFLSPSKVATMSFGSVMVTPVDCLAHGATICPWILVKIWSCAVAKSPTIKTQQASHGMPTHPLYKPAIVLPVDIMSTRWLSVFTFHLFSSLNKNKRPVNTYRPLISYQPLRAWQVYTLNLLCASFVQNGALRCSNVVSTHVKSDSHQCRHKWVATDTKP